ncbi:MAG: COX15/CtaA family protein [Bernardetiaceae bacterium]|nr:COX15/CtaA family protein [Bernardetiaceae bacterium]
MRATYRKFGILTILLVYLLILVGGIVRSTGSGMGCPDWPKCFGQWVPPTDVSELPVDYKTIFEVQGKEIADFNAFHTWTEYINRLIGVLIGFAVFVTFVLSFGFFKTDRRVFYLSLFAFLLVGFQGWLGSVVVATDLHPFIITLHMLLAIVIVGVLIYTVMRAHDEVLVFEDLLRPSNISWVLIVALLFTIIQIVLGTQVREAIDIVAKKLGESARETWVESLGIEFYIHRSFSWVLVAINVWLWLQVRRNTTSERSPFRFWTFWLMVVLGLEFLTGIGLGYLGFPAYLQPLHLLFGTAIFGFQFVLLLLLYYDKLVSRKMA